MTTIPKILLLASLLAATSIAAIEARAQAAPSAYTTGYRYDGAGRLIGTILPSAGGTSAPFQATRTVYSGLGLVDHVDTGYLSAWQPDTTSPLAWSGFTIGRTVYYTYDSWGRKLTEKTTASGLAYALTQYSYDSAGRVMCVAQRMNVAAYTALPADACTLGTEGTQGPDRITTTTYDALDRPLVVQKAYGTPLAYTYATYTYAAGGPLQSVTDANGNTTGYAYDSLVRLQRWYFPLPTTKGSYNPSDYEEYGYDAAGQRTSLRKRDGNTITYEYDDLGRVKDERYPAGTIRNVYNTYDLRGLQRSTTFDSPTGAGLSASYDGFGHVVSATTTVSGTARTLSYQYDAEGNRTRITHPDGNFFQYGYDGMNRLTGIQENGATAVIGQAYDAFGRRQTLSRGANVATTSYAYDGVGRLGSLSQDLQGTAYDDVRTFAYNPANQVVTRTLSNASFGFTQVAAVNTAYTVNGLNQYTAFAGGTTASPTYDANGNMTYDGQTTYHYDVLNRLVSSTGFRTINMVYDPKGRLFQSVGPNDPSQLLYDGDALVAEYDTAGNLKHRYVHGSGVDEPLVGYDGSAVGASTRRYYFADQQGSVVAASDAGGNELQLNTYDPYGVPAVSNTTRFQYTGQIYLPDLLQYYYKARIYNPTIGRFLQTDPVGYQDDLELYSYVGNDPMNKEDPTGQVAELHWTSSHAVTLVFPYRLDESRGPAGFSNSELRSRVAEAYSGKFNVGGHDVEITARAELRNSGDANTLHFYPNVSQAPGADGLDREYSDTVGGKNSYLKLASGANAAAHELAHLGGAGDQYAGGRDAQNKEVSVGVPGPPNIMRDNGATKANNQTMTELLKGVGNTVTCARGVTAPVGKCQQ